MSGYHAKLSPSSAHRWMACPASVQLSVGAPNTSSEHAREGTAAHYLASEWLERGGRHAAKITADPDGYPIDDEMRDYVRKYVELVHQYAEDGELYVEQKLPIGHLTGEEGATGTSDACIVKEDGKGLVVIDLKYGRGVEVSADANEQLLMYALGAERLHATAGVYFKAESPVTLVIIQPRLNAVSEWTLTMADLLAFGSRVSLAAAATRQSAPTANPGEDQCRWCPALGKCEAAARRVQDIIEADFEMVSEDKAAPLPATSSLASAMQAIPFIENWCKAVRGQVEVELLAGNSVDGFKLVQGKRGARRWADEEAAEAELKAMRIKKDDMYDFKVISPTSAEKFFKEEPKRWARLQPLITQSEGGLSVAPVSDKRPAVTPTAAASAEFDIEN